MTEEQLKAIRNFEVRMRQILFLCDRLKEENAGLKSQLEALKSSTDSLRENNIQLNLKYDTLKMARLISVSRDDFKATQNRLSNLVREVDKCIALLNE